MSSLYAYALVDERPGKDVQLGTGIARQPLSLVAVGRCFAVVEAAKDFEPTTAKIVAHDRVVRRLCRHFSAVLPMRFGMTAEGPAALRALVRPLAGELASAFDRVRDAVQFTLRVSGARTARSSRARATKGVGPGTRWLSERLAVQRIPEVACVLEGSAPWIREQRIEGRVSSSGGLGTVYQLVAATDVRSWRRAVAGAMPSLPRGVEVSVTGPWPPYAFVGST